MIQTHVVEPSFHVSTPLPSLLASVRKTLLSRFWWSITPTLLRLPLGLLIAASVLISHPDLAVALLVVFVVVDIFDGVMARALYDETATRRAADSIIDKISIHSVAACVAIDHPQFIAVWAFLLLRDLIQTAVAVRVLRLTRLVTNGPQWHVVYTLSLALWGSVWIERGASPMWLSWLVVGLAFFTLRDFVASSAPVVARAGTRQTI